MALDRTCRIVVVLLALCAFDVRAVLAQQSGAKPRRSGLFGGPQGAGQLVDMTVSMSGAYDDDLSGEQVGGPALAGTRIGGQSSDLNISLSLAQRRRRLGLTAHATSTIRRYPDLNNFIGSNHGAGVGLTANLGSRTTVFTQIDASYASYFPFDAFSRQSALPQLSPSSSGSVENPPAESMPLDLSLTSFGGTAVVTRKLGRRASLGLTYGVRYSEPYGSPYSQQVILGEYDERTVGAQFGRSLGKDTSVQVLYTFHDGGQRLGGVRHPVKGHDAQLGLDRQWRHSAISRTALSLTAGPSALERDGARLIRIVGTAVLSQEIGGWRARISFRRGAGLVNSLVPSDAATVDLRRSLGQRVELTGSGGYADPEVGFDLGARYRTSFGSARLQVAVTSHLAAYAQYVFYRYDFGSSTTSPVGYPPQTDRRGLRVGLSAWLPLQRGR
jgi:hypothetical protein